MAGSKEIAVTVRAVWGIAALLLALLQAQVPAAAGPVGPYSEAATALKRLAGNNSRVRLTNIGRSVEGRPIHAVTLLPDASRSDPRTLPRLLILSGQHGDEATPVWAALECIRMLSTDRERLQGAVVTFIPVVNPDGLAAGGRYNAAGVDLNRDWLTPDQPETAAVARFLRQMRPQIVIDLHEWTSAGSDCPDCIEVAGFGNGPGVGLGRTIAQAGLRRTSACGLPLRPIHYTARSNPRLAHRRFSADGLSALLVETNRGHPQSARLRAYREIILCVLDEIRRPSEPHAAACLAALQTEHPPQRTWLASVYEDPPARERAKAGRRACWIAVITGCVWIAGLFAAPKRPDAFRSSSPRPGRRVDSPVFALAAARSGLPIGTRLALLRSRRAAYGKSGWTGGSGPLSRWRKPG